MLNWGSLVRWLNKIFPCSFPGILQINRCSSSFASAPRELLKWTGNIISYVQHSVVMLIVIYIFRYLNIFRYVYIEISPCKWYCQSMKVKQLRVEVMWKISLMGIKSPENKQTKKKQTLLLLQLNLCVLKRKGMFWCLNSLAECFT